LALHRDLLEQAAHLATRESKKPKQASLRRSVSAAYYALFHPLVSEGAGLLAPTKPSAIRNVVSRAFDHGHMRSVCAGFVQGSAGKRVNKSVPPATQKLLHLPLDPRLVAVSESFLALQEARHLADYDLAKQWKRYDAPTYVRMAQRAFENWQKIRKTPDAIVFLTALLLQRQWAR
jgi:hypothetical protein